VLQLLPHEPRLLFATTDTTTRPAGDADDYKRYVETQRTLIKSRLVLEAALKEKRVAGLAAIKNRTDPSDWLEHSLVVTNPENTALLQIELASGSGASNEDQAALMNAVVHAYLHEVVDFEHNKRSDRLAQLRSIKEHYAQMLRERRRALGKLRDDLSSAGAITTLEREALAHLYEKLVAKRVELRLDRAEVETLLARRKKSVGRAGVADPVRMEIDQLEERLAINDARQHALGTELEQLTQKLRGATHSSLDLDELNEEIAQMEDASRAIGAEIEKLNTELFAPPRVRLIEEARAGK
jgi:hypothetical protein